MTGRAPPAIAALGQLPAKRGAGRGAGLRGFSPFPLPEPLPNKTANKRSPLMPTVTVIIPVYKVERYLDACVESVVRQSYADLEILLVDDGSPDRCPALIIDLAMFAFCVTPSEAT